MSAKEERLEFVAELTLLGYSPAKIAERLGVTETTIKNDLVQVRTRWEQNRQKSYTQYVEEELETQKMLMRSLEKGIAEGSWKHVETALKITERRARVMGLDHMDRMEQARVEIESRQLDLITRAFEAALERLDLSDEQHEIVATAFIGELEEPVLEIEADDDNE